MWWRLGVGGVLAARARAASVGPAAWAAVRLQRRRERALPPARDRDVRPRARTPTTSSTRPPTRTCCTSLLAIRYGGRLAVGRRLRDRPDGRVDDGPRGERGARHDRGRAAATSRASGWPGARAGLLAAALLGRRLPARLLQPPRAQRRSDARPAVLVAVGRRGRPAVGPGRCDYVGRRDRRSGCRAATKYTGGIVAARAAGRLRSARAARPPRVRSRGLLLAARGGARRVPASPTRTRCIDHREFRDGLSHQSDASREARGQARPQAGQRRGSTTCGRSRWGLGWVPLVARRDRAAGPAAARRWALLAFLRAGAASSTSLFMGLAGALLRPLAACPSCRSSCLLAAYLRASMLVDGARRAARRRWRPMLGALAAVALLRPGARVLDPRRAGAVARGHARADARDWLVAARARRHADRRRARRRPRRLGAGHRRRRRPVTAERQPLGASTPRAGRSSTPTPGARCRPPGIVVNIEDFERTLRPALIDLYERAGYCWVVDRTRTQRGRAEAEPGKVPRGDRLLPASWSAAATSPTRFARTRRAAARVPFNFDWSFNYYPLAYDAPGAGDDGLPPAGRCVRDVDWPTRAACSPTPTRSYLDARVELAGNGLGRVHPNPLVGAVVVRDGDGARRGLARRSTAGRTRRSRRSPRATAPTDGRDALRLARALLPHGQEPPCTDGDRRPRGIAPRRRRLRRPDRAGLRPRAGDPARRGHRRRTWPAATLAAPRPAPQPGVPQARPHRPAVGRCSSPR